ncbi:MAG: hypothetical protein V3R81_12755, partial [Gammaproteobacteria bacterium]
MLRASILATVALVAANAVADQCSRDWACVEVEQSDGGVDIYARNKKPYPITVTVAVPANAGGSREAVTVSVPGLSRRSVTRLPATLRREDSSADYKYDWTIGWLNP